MGDFIFDLQRFDSAFSGGSGTESDPYQISSAQDLQTLATDVNGGNGYSGKYFKVTKDIDLTGVTYTAIGNNDLGYSSRFKGKFDGDGYTISNLTINNNSNFQGLFGMTENATIKNVNLTSVNVTGGDYVGALVGRVVSSNTVEISNCTAEGSVAAGGDGAVGGLVGYFGGGYSGAITNSAFLGGNITSTNSEANVGGLVGYNNGTITNSAFLGGNIISTNNNPNKKPGAISGYLAYSTGKLIGNYYYGTLATDVDDNSATLLNRKFTVPRDVTCSGDGLIQFGNICGTTKDSVDVTFTYGGKDYKYTISEDIIVTINENKLYVNDTALGGNWQSDGASSIKYQHNGNTLLTIDGLSKSDYLNLSDKVVAVGESALWARAKDTITIDNDYTFVFGDGATEISGKSGVTITEDGVYKFADGFTGTVTISAQNVKLIGATSQLTNVYIDASSVEDINLWIKDLNITTSNYGNNLIKFGNGNNYLTVKGENKLINTADDDDNGRAVINSGSGTLNILGDGNLTAQFTQQGSDGAAIGGDIQQTVGNINVGSKVVINAVSKSGAAIGSGYQGSCGTITIGGNATVNATTECIDENKFYTGAAIGSGAEGSAGDITIGGTATVNATVPNNNAEAIGAGEDSSGTGTITYGKDATINDIQGTDDIEDPMASITTPTDPSGDEDITAIYGTGGQSGWHLKNDFVTFNLAGESDYFTLESSKNQITYHEEILGAAQVSLGGVSNYNSLEDPTSTSVVTFAADNFTSDGISVLSNSANYKFVLSQGDYSDLKFYGSSGDDEIINYGENVTIDTSEGDDTILADVTGKSFNVTGFGNGDVIFLAKYDSIEEEEVHLTITSLGSADDSLLAVVDNDGTADTITIGGIALGDVSISSDGKSIVFGDNGGGNDDDKGDDDKDNDDTGIIFNNKKKETKSTSATLSSGFEGTFDAKKHRKLTTIKAAKNFSSDIQITGNVNDNKITSGSGDDTINGGRGNNKIDGGAGNDLIYGGGIGADTLTGGKGLDIFVYDGKGQDVITDYTAGEDTVSIDGALKRASISGSNVVFRVGRSGTLTLNKTVGKKITYTDADGEEITEIYRSEGKYDEDETELEVFSTFEGTFTANNTLETINGGDVKDNSLNIFGNDRDNSIIGGSKDDLISGGKGSDTLDGGKGADSLFGGDGDDLLIGGYGGDTLRGGSGNDTLEGGTGRNIFVYESGDDVITDFNVSNSNRIQLLNDSVTIDYEISDDDLILDFTGGSLTVKNYDGDEIKFLDAKNNESSYVFTENVLLNGTKTHATLISGDSYTADDKITQIDASELGKAEITGNWRKNSIIASDSGCTIAGGTGSDSLWGGDGADTFIYDAGDGRDVIFGFGDGDALEINGIDNITATYKDGAVKIHCGRGSITLKDFTTNEFAINDETWTLSGNTITKN